LFARIGCPIGEPLRFVAKPSLMQCRKCLSDTDLTIAIVMERSHPPFSIWFWAAYLLSHQRHGMSALQFQRQMGFKRYETAFQIIHKLRAAVVRPALDRITWLRGIHHAVSHHHFKADLNEFKFRFNRRVYPFNAFRSLLDIAGEIAAPTYADFYSGEWFHPSFSGPERATTGYLRLQ